MSTNISAAPLTDHCLIQLSFSIKDKQFYNRGYWKFNSTLLYNESFSEEIIQEITNIYNDTNIHSNISKWELFKFRTRQIAIKHSKLVAKSSKQKEVDTIKEINHIAVKLHSMTLINKE